MADFENSTNEDFENYPTGGYRSNWNAKNHTVGGTYSQLLNGGVNGQVGVARSYKVYPGDKVKVKAYATYVENGSQVDLTGFAGALLQAFGLPAPAPGETSTAAAALEAYGNFVAGGNGNDDETGPRVFVNMLIFDKAFNFLDMAYKQVSLSAATTHELLEREVLIQEEGYVFVYISNEHPTRVDAYFDDVEMTHTKTNIIQYNEHYPFGLQASTSWTRDNNDNNFLYNQGSELNTTTEWYETYFRGYDATLGRFLQVDPMASKYARWSPYVYSLNDPIFWNDPTGADVTWDDLIQIINYLWEHGGGQWTRTAYERSLMQADEIGGGPCPGCTVFGNNASYEYYGGSGGGTLYVTSNNSTYSNYGNIGGQATVTVIDINFNNKTADYAGWDFGEGTIATQGGVQQTGMGTDLSLYLLSVASYAGGVYEDVRAGQIAKQTKGMLNEWQQIRNFNKGYKKGRQATLASNIIKNVNTLDAMKVASRRMIGVGLVLGVADMANNDFSAESVGWFAADAIMTGVGLTGWGAPVAGIYFLGRFAYGIYEMSNK